MSEATRNINKIKRILAVAVADLNSERRTLSTSLVLYGFLFNRFLSNLSSAMPLICLPLFISDTLNVLKRKTSDPALFYAHLPVRRREVVIGHYLYIFFPALTILLVISALGIFDFVFEQQVMRSEELYAAVLLPFVYETLMALLFGLHFRFATKKNINSLLNYSLRGGTVLLIVIDQSTGFISFAWKSIMELTLRGSPLFLLAPIALGFLLLMLSCRISCEIYEKQDFEYLEPAIIAPRTWGKVRTNRHLVSTDGTIVMLESTRRYRSMGRGRILPLSCRKRRTPSELLVLLKLAERKRLRRAAEQEAEQKAQIRNHALPVVAVIGLLVLILFILSRS